MIFSANFRSFIIAGLLVATVAAFGAEKSRPASQLRVAVVQLALSDTIASNRDRIVVRISEAAARNARASG